MSVILQPQAAFPVVRQISNHLDSATYYVRAVVRDANGSTIDTVNLASQGGQRYQTSWQVPADSSGQGRYISIVTSVYTNSGYTTKSENYGDEETTYLIFDRVMPAMRGGGRNIDYYTFRKIVKEEIEKAKPEPIEIPEQKEYEMRWDEILGKIEMVERAVKKAIESNKPKDINLAPVLGVVKDTMEQGVNQIAQVIIANNTEPDLTPILEAVKEVRDSIVQDIKIGDLEDFKGEMASNIENTVKEAIKQELDNTEFTSVFLTKKKQPEVVEAPVEDLQDNI